MQHDGHLAVGFAVATPIIRGLVFPGVGPDTPNSAVTEQPYTTETLLPILNAMHENPIRGITAGAIFAGSYALARFTHPYSLQAVHAKVRPVPRRAYSSDH